MDCIFRSEVCLKPISELPTMSNTTSAFSDDDEVEDGDVEDGGDDDGDDDGDAGDDDGDDDGTDGTSRQPLSVGVYQAHHKGGFQNSHTL